MKACLLFIAALCALAVATPAAQPTPRSVSCTICTAIVGFAEEKLGSNATLAQIETFLNTTVCHFLPSFLRTECAALVDEYAPVIAQKIFQGFPASVICQDIGLCSSTRKVSPAAQVAFKPQSVGCSICTLIVGYAEEKLGSNATLAEIETFLNTTVCHFLPSFLRSECAAIVDEYAPEIAQKIFQGFPASVVCADIGLCTSAAVVSKPQLLMKLRPAHPFKMLPLVKKHLMRKLTLAKDLKH